MEEVIISGFQKNPTTTVVGLVNEYNGRRLAHLREMIAATNDAGWIHGPGVAVSAERMPMLAAAIAKLQDVASLDALVATMESGHDQIRVGTQTFQGHQLVYVRKFFERDGEWLPSKQGVSVRTAFVDDLVDLAHRTAEAASRVSGGS